jgi:kynurenine formamidase
VSTAKWTEADVRALLDQCSNQGRWGPNDGLGTANLITDEKRIEAASLVRRGQVTPMGRVLDWVAGPTNPIPPRHQMLYTSDDEPSACADTLEIAPHGFAITHLDAVGHMYLEGRMYNGRAARESVSADGLKFASIRALEAGIFTRGVLLDVARARGLDWLEPTYGISVDDLSAAERVGHVNVKPGDAVVIRSGSAARARTLGLESWPQRAGLLPECIPWLFEHDVAVYSGDCTEKLPSPYPGLPFPLHQIGMVTMGLVMLDNVEVEELAKTAADTGRYEFLLTAAPIRADGLTGAPVNPIAVW